MPKGPMYDAVELLDVLPMSPENPGGMRQQLPSESDLRAIMQNHSRVVAGYEILLSHFLRAVRLFRRFDAHTYVVATHVGTGELHCVFSVPCADWAELSSAMEQVEQSVPG